MDPARLRRMLSSVHVDCELEDNKPVRLRNAGGLRLTCTEGIAWITFYGELEDLMLHAGQTAVVPNDRVALMEAVGRGRVRIALERRTMARRAGDLLEAALPLLRRLSIRRALPD